MFPAIPSFPPPGVPLPSGPGADGRFHALFEQATAALIIFDDDCRCVNVNAAAVELLGLPEAGLLGQRLDALIALPTAEDSAGDAAYWAGLVEPGQRLRECTVRRPDGETRRADCRLTLQFLPGLHLCEMHDASDRQQIEQSYRTLVETTDTGYAIADPAGFILDANAEYVRLSGHSSLAEILGLNWEEWTQPADRPRAAGAFASCAAGGQVRNLEIDYTHPRGAVQPVEINASAIDTQPGVRLLALCRGITERRRGEQAIQAAQGALEDRVRERTLALAHANAQLRSRSQRQEILARFGHRSLMGASADALMREAAELIGRTLEVDYCEALEWKGGPGVPVGGGADLLRRAGFGWPGDPVDCRVASSVGDSLEGFVLRAHEPVVFEDLAGETRFAAPERLRELGVVSGIDVVIDGESRPFGVLGAHSRRRRAFTADDVYFVQTFANVLAEVIKRRQAEETIRAAQREATRANNAKNEFLSRMSHELRTPLNAILGFGQLLEIEDLAASQRESVDQITHAGRHLLEMVNEVLDISRIESGHLALSLEAVGLRQIALETADLIRPLAAERGIEVIVHPELAACVQCVTADRQRLRQTLLNLLSNAVKYNRDDGRITLALAAASRPESARLQVIDTGVGISAEKAFRLFTPFERLGAENTEVEGDGIGLALSKRLMEAQGGDLGFEGRPGEGSTFWIELPCASEPAPEDIPLDILHTLLDDSKGALAAPAPDHPQTVLHIEDNESNRLLVELLFVQRPALHLLSAARGMEGLQLARDQHPDLILLDMHLPDTPGEEVLHSLRADDRTRGTPVVVISADASGPRIRRLREAGADDYLTKPFNVGQFFRMLDEHLAPASL